MFKAGNIESPTSPYKTVRVHDQRKTGHLHLGLENNLQVQIHTGYKKTSTLHATFHHLLFSTVVN